MRLHKPLETQNSVSVANPPVLSPPGTFLSVNAHPTAQNSLHWYLVPAAPEGLLVRGSGDDPREKSPVGYSNHWWECLVCLFPFCTPGLASLTLL